MCRKVIWDQVENVGARPSSAHPDIMIRKGTTTLYRGH